MDFWLKKTLTIPFLPLYFTLLTGLAGVILLCLRRQRPGRILVVLAILALATFSNKGVAVLLLASLENRHPPVPEAQSPAGLPPAVASCRAIVVLGGGHSRSPQLSRVNQLSTSMLSRLTEALRLARLLPEARLVTSGHDGEGRISHARVVAEAAASLGFPTERIITLDTPRDTADEVREIARLLGGERFVLVTSAWHMPRAMALCEKAGLHPVAAPADFMLRPQADTGSGLLAWDLGALERSTKAIHERLGLLWARLRGNA